ncbi:hypothetical protein, partial [Thiolapillus sp.]
MQAAGHEFDIYSFHCLDALFGSCGHQRRARLGVFPGKFDQALYFFRIIERTVRPFYFHSEPWPL